jgi:hypothetical protein
MQIVSQHSYRAHALHIRLVQRSQQRRDRAHPAGALLPNDHRLAAYYELRVVQKAEPKQHIEVSETS